MYMYNTINLFVHVYHTLIVHRYMYFSKLYIDNSCMLYTHDYCIQFVHLVYIDNTITKLPKHRVGNTET